MELLGFGQDRAAWSRVPAGKHVDRILSKPAGLVAIAVKSNRMVVHELGWQFPVALISAKKGSGENLVKRPSICKADF